MKIIQANKHYYLRSGADRYILELSAWLEKQGHKVLPFSMKYPDNLETIYSQYFVSEVYTHIPKKNWQGIRTLGRMTYSLEARRKLATLIADEHPEIAHIHNIYTQLSPSILHTCADQHVPVVMTVHDHHLVSPQYNLWADGCGKNYQNIGIIKGALARYHKHSFFASLAQTAVYRFHRWLRIYEKHVDRFICPSQYMKQKLIAGGFPSQKIVVNQYGIDVTQIEPSFNHNGYILFVGRLSEEKGIETIIRAASFLQDVPFKIVGRGPEMEKLHALADGLKNVEFLGFRMGEELTDLYKNALAVVVPSRVHENAPLVVLEAMATGTPVIASYVGGVPELIDDRRNGLLVQPTDLEGWVEAIARLAYDEEFRLSMAHVARTTIETTFQIDDHYNRLMNIYQDVLSKQQKS